MSVLIRLVIFWLRLMQPVGRAFLKVGRSLRRIFSSGWR